MSKPTGRGHSGKLKGYRWGGIKNCGKSEQGLEPGENAGAFTYLCIGR
jgi:hypothetical protein